MTHAISKCGFNCGSCPWGPYARQNMSSEEFEQYRKDAKKILGYKPTEKPCFTCQTPNENLPKGSKLPPQNCLVRRCLGKIGAENCAFCSRFPCGQIRDLGTAWTREKFEAEKGPISEENYVTFIQPFEGLGHLKEIRANLSPGDIVEAATIPPSKMKIVDFPENLPFSKRDTAAFKAVHELLATMKRSQLGLTDTDTYAQRERLRQRMTEFFRFLWILGRFGRLDEENGATLVVDAKTYIENRGSEKNLASWPYVEQTVLKILSEFGVSCQRVTLEGIKNKDLTTGTGYLRSKGWVMTLSFDKDAVGTSALKALQTYTTKLDETYGKKAFRHFSDVDMRVLSSIEGE